jgi:hypothetical protein
MIDGRRTIDEHFFLTGRMFLSVFVEAVEMRMCIALGPKLWG